MSACSDPPIQNLLHAYELQLLTEEQVDRLETHLMSCTDCRIRLEAFQPAALLLQGDPEVVRLVGQRTRRDPHSEPTSSRWRRLRDALWPDTALFLRPAFAYAIVLCLVISGLVAFGDRRDGQIQTVRSVVLFPGRGSGGEALRISGGDAGLLDFHFPGAVEGRPYRLRIVGGEGEEIYDNAGFSGFDEYENGRLVLPLARMKPGSYRLLIDDPRRDPSDRREYRFRIDP